MDKVRHFSFEKKKRLSLFGFQRRDCSFLLAGILPERKRGWGETLVLQFGTFYSVVVGTEAEELEVGGGEMEEDHW